MAKDKPMSNARRIKRCSQILNSLKDNDFVENKSDFDFLLETFALGPYFEMKTQGQKIVKIQRRATSNKHYHTPCFFLIRADGTATDISYTKLFRKDPVTDDILNALRWAIDPIISEFRRTFKPDFYDGTWIEKVQDADVDHYDLRFNELASIWIEQNGGIENLSQYINDTEDGDTNTRLTDFALVDSFRTFHNAHTHLRFATIKKNRGSGAKK